MSLFNYIRENVFLVFRSFFLPDMGVISEDTKRLLANPQDKEKYLDAVKELREKIEKGEKQPRKTITLSDKSEITLTT